MLEQKIFMFDRHEILGEGGHGLVYKGMWHGIPVAVKRKLQLNNFTNEREERALLKLNHPNVIKLFHADGDQDFKHYVLELCEASLDRLFLKDGDPRKYRGPMPQEIEVLYQLAIGLEYIHQMKVIHRNIKPENVLIWVNPITDQVLMKWSGFGLNKEVNERGTYSMSGIRGTYNWLAPEILKLLQLDEANKAAVKQRGTVKTDVFPEGLVFGYFLLKGLHLFGTPMQIQTNIIESAPVNLCEIGTENVRALIKKMLTTKPEDRITSSDVVQLLNQFLEKDKRTYATIKPQASVTLAVKTNLNIQLDKGTILGRGDYGKVFQSEWNNKQVAVKRIKLCKVRRYNQEEELLMKRLDHTNVTKLFHVEDDLAYRYYALELCAASLEQLFWKNDDHSKYLESMPPAEEVFYQLAIGLDYIHKTGFIHRDIKPQNVLIWTNPTTNEVVMKWGGLRLSKGGNKTEKNDSTLDWLAPELLKLLDKGDFDVLPTVKSDVFAQGLVFGYYLLRGQHLFGSPVKAASNIMANEPVNLQKIQNQVIRDLIKIILEPNPEIRMTSSDVAEKLKKSGTGHTNLLPQRHMIISEV